MRVFQPTNRVTPNKMTMADNLSTSPDSVATAPNHDFPRKRDAELTLEEFVSLLPSTIDQVKNRAHHDKPAEEDLIANLMQRLVLDPEDYQPYALFDSSKNYTRNLVATDNRTFTLLLLCWNPGRSSPIHDHPCDGCWMRVCEGSIQECRFQTSKDCTSEALHCTSDEIYREGEFCYIQDSMGYHKVGNPGTTPAITLHLYSPPFQSCKVWMSTSSKPCQSCVCYHSEYGHLV